MNNIGVMHIIDSLALGGSERAAVNLVNSLPRESYRTYLCTTRAEGPLEDAVASDVGRLSLNRQGAVDVKAIRRLVKFIRAEKIEILHAHGSSLFVAALAACFSPYPKVIWHAHFGRFAHEDRKAWLHRLAIRRTRAIITVNHQLAEWCGRRLGVPKDRVWCIANMVCESGGETQVRDLPGSAGSRIICVANLRDEKDHPTLIRAMALVVRSFPYAHLLLVGAYSDAAHSAGASYFEAVKEEISRNSLGRNISFLGQRRDIPALLKASDIGVLSSRTEGLPVSLLEYGVAGLPVVATRVGECAEVLDHGRAGLVVVPESPRDLADALISLLDSPQQRAHFGAEFRKRVQELYSPAAISAHVGLVYREVLRSNRAEATRTESAQDGIRA